MHCLTVRSTSENKLGLCENFRSRLFCANTEGSRGVKLTQGVQLMCAHMCHHFKRRYFLGDGHFVPRCSTYSSQVGYVRVDGTFGTKASRSAGSCQKVVARQTVSNAAYPKQKEKIHVRTCYPIHFAEFGSPLLSVFAKKSEE